MAEDSCGISGDGQFYALKKMNSPAALVPPPFSLKPEGACLDELLDDGWRRKKAKAES